jgi:type IV secretion system protein TrbG
MLLFYRSSAAACLALLALSGLSVEALAQSVPAPDPAAAPQPPPETSGGPHTPPPVNLLNGRDSSLTMQEREAVRRSRSWIEQNEPPSAGDAGHVVYTYGTSLPSIVCAPLHVCDIELQSGETVNDINAGDPVRWKITPAFSGAAESKTTHVVVKPTDTALTTDLIITTDRRTYVLKLVSRLRDWMPVVSFSYPEDTHAQWAAYKAASEQQTQATVLPTGESLDTLDFGFEVKARGHGIDWRPVRIYTNGAKTFIEFPSAVSHGDLPALVALDGKTEALVNYRLAGDRFVVDKLLRHAALIRGVGAQQQRIELNYTGKL